MTAPCLARLEDCRCGGEIGHDRHGAGFHHCALPGCNALWTGTGHIAQLPGKTTLRRRFDRPDLRVVA